MTAPPRPGRPAPPAAPTGAGGAAPHTTFAVPDEAALTMIAAASPDGVVEIGAGTGYWAKLLHDRGVDVVAYDIAPPPSIANQWFAGQAPWFPVLAGDERSVLGRPERTLLLVWPTWNEQWAADAARLHLEQGGRRLVYVGEPPGGRTGDPQLHVMLGLVGPCLACTYGTTNAPCTCAVVEQWVLDEQLVLGAGDHLYLFTSPRHAPTAPSPKRRWRPRTA